MVLEHFFFYIAHYSRIILIPNQSCLIKTLFLLNGLERLKQMPKYMKYYDVIQHSFLYNGFIKVHTSRPVGMGKQDFVIVYR